MKKARTQKEVRGVKKRILDKALHILAHEGFESLTLRKLAQKTGMTAPNIYNYFQNKDEIYITLVIRGFADLKKRMENAAAQHAEPRSRARALARAYLGFGLENASTYDIMFTRRTPRHKDYVGTPLEKLSQQELSLSMEIADLAATSLRELLGPELSGEDLALGVIRVWSLLHGMITLNHSQVMEYVVQDVEDTCYKLVDRELEILSALIARSSSPDPEHP